MTNCRWWAWRLAGWLMIGLAAVVGSLTVAAVGCGTRGLGRWIAGG